KRGRPLSHVRVARSAGEQAVAPVSSQRHGGPQGVQHHGPFQPARLSGQPRERRLRRLRERRRPDVPWQVGVRILRKENTISLWLTIPLGVAIIAVLIKLITARGSSVTTLHIDQ